MKLYTEEQVIELTKAAFTAGQNHNSFIFWEELKNITPVELPSDEEIMKHIDYLISCRQNLIDNADNMPQHLLEGGCMAFESAIDNARELFYGGNK